MPDSSWNGFDRSIMSNIKLKPPEFKKPGDYFVQSNTRILYEFGTDKKLQTEDFMSLFCTGGSLHYLFDNIWSWESPYRGTYEICFKEINDDVKKLEKLLSNHKAEKMKLSSGNTVFVKMGYPWQPVHQLTLRGVPIEYSLPELTKDINLMGWGEVKDVSPGRHKRSSTWSQVRNNLLHVKMVKADMNLIPRIFWLCGHEVYVTKPGERIKQHCDFCKRPWHLEETCWKKREQIEMERREKEFSQRKEERERYLEEQRRLREIEEERLHKVEEERQRREEEERLQKEQKDAEKLQDNSTSSSSSLNNTFQNENQEIIDPQIIVPEFSEAPIAGDKIDLSSLANQGKELVNGAVDETNIGLIEEVHNEPVKLLQEVESAASSDVSNKEESVKENVSYQSSEIINANNDTVLVPVPLVKDGGCCSRLSVEVEESPANSVLESEKENDTSDGSLYGSDYDTDDDTSNHNMVIGSVTQSLLDVPEEGISNVAAHEVVATDVRSTSDLSNPDLDDFTTYAGRRPNKKRKGKSRSKTIVIGSQNRVLRAKKDVKLKPSHCQNDSEEYNTCS